MGRTRGRWMNLVYKPIPCTLEVTGVLTPDACKDLLNIDLKGLIEIQSYPITSINCLKIEAYKHDFRWVEEKGYTVFTYRDIRAFKASFQGMWFQVNPKIDINENILRESIYNLILKMPSTFALLLGNVPKTKEEIRLDLCLPF